MPTPAVIRGSDQFFVTTYEGTGTGQRVGKFLPFTNNGTIAKGCIFASGDSPVLSHTLGGDGNKKKFTISAWVKPCKFTGDYQSILVGGGTGNGTASAGLYFNANMQIYIYFFGADSLITNRTFVDTSKFYHIVVRVDSSDSTADDRVRLYVDGTQITSFATRNNPSQEAEDTLFNVGSNIFNIGKHTSGNAYYYLDNVLAEVNFADGQSYGPDTFGITDTSTGRWIPKSLTGITYGTNGFRAEFANSAGQTVGDDTSGQGNDFTVTNLAATDIVTDTPTQNFITFGNGERYLGTKQTTEQGGLTIYAASGSGYTAMAANKEIPQSGKWYWEVKLDAVGNVNGISNPGYGVIDRNIKEITGFSTGSEFVNQTGGMGATFWSGFRFTSLQGTSTELTIGSYTAAEDDYVVFAFDMDDGKAWWGFKDGSADLVFYANDGGTDGNPSTGANPTITFNPKDHRFVPVQGFYAPGSGYSARYHYNFGQKAYAFTAPTGFSGLSQNNYPETGKGIPDFVWIKNRDATDDHQLYDTTRGVQKDLNFDSSAAEGTTVDGLQKFLKGGFAIEDDVSVNTVSESYVNYSWVCNGGTTSANTSATPTIASNFQVNDTAGFSIVTYTGTGSAGTVQHGLSKAPEWMIVKERGNSNGFIVSHKGLTSQATYSVNVAGNNAEYSDAGTYYWNSTAPTSSVFSIATDTAVNRSSGSYVAWCWHSVEGFSKFGRYTGNGSSNGTFVFLGFKPKFVIIKGTNASNFNLFDTARNPLNPLSLQLYADTTEVDYNLAARGPDFLSNGFKHNQEAGYGSNNDGQRYIYMAFAEHPFIGDGTNPATAR